MAKISAFMIGALLMASTAAAGSNFDLINRAIDVYNGAAPCIGAEQFPIAYLDLKDQHNKLNRIIGRYKDRGYLTAEDMNTLRTFIDDWDYISKQCQQLSAK